MAAAIALLVASPFLQTLSGTEPQLTARQRLDQIREEVRAAHAAGDAAAYLAKSREMRDLLNGSPSSVLQVMGAEAFGADNEAAMKSFARYIAMGQSESQVFKGKQFDPLRTLERFRTLEKDMHRNEAPIATSAEVFTMPEPGMIPEDIDYDPASKQFYVSSVMKKEILTLDVKGHSRIFARAPDAWPIMALKIDARRRTLWATEVALNGFASVPKADWKTSAILIYDLASGKLLHRVRGPAHTTLGDMVLTAEGDAIVSDNDGGVYRVKPETLGVERVDEGDFISPQTAAVDPDGRHVFVPDYLRGIAILDLKTKQVSWLEGEGEHALSGIDGLYLSGRTLIATQNGASPERVVRFQLDESLRKIESETVIERATSDLGDPTHGVVTGGKFYYIANSGWDTVEDDGSTKAGATPARALLMRADLGPKKN
ncbi:MAG TPA: hypothetical protein VFD98_14285 [Terracidiphilus sp.]|nr:hypothetical protein [Terracidiphilus sp.]